MAFLPLACPDITEARIEAVVETMRSGRLTTGPNVAALEREFVELLGADTHGVAINSATVGLHLTFEAIGVRSRTEVLVPTWAFTFTAEAMRYLGGDSALTDVDPGTLCTDLGNTERKITGRTIAIAPVHFSGLAVPDGALTGLAERHSPKVVEDAARSFPTSSEGKLASTHGHEATVYNFYATKTMTTSEGGMVVTPDADPAARIHAMRFHGINRDVFDRYPPTELSRHYDVVVLGCKHNLTDTAVVMERMQLTRANEVTDRYAAIASRFDASFADLPATLPTCVPEDFSYTWHLYVMRLSPDAPVSRDRFIELMAEHEVNTSVHFIPLHPQSYWRDTYHHALENFPVITAEFARVVSLPTFSIMTGDDVTQVVDAVWPILG